METVEDVYKFLSAHPIVLDHDEAVFLRRLFLDLAAGHFEERAPRETLASVLSFL